MAGAAGQAPQHDRQALAKYLGVLGGHTLASLTPVLVGAVVRDAAGEVSPATASRDMAALRAVLNAAVESDLIARSPLRGVRLAPVEPPSRPTLTPEDLERLADAIHPRFRALILIGGWVGLRWSEAIALRVDDIDFLRRTITVSHTISEVSGHLADDETKSRVSRRTLAVPPFLIDEVAARLAANRPGVTPNDLVFVGRNGAPLRRSFAARHFTPAVACRPASATPPASSRWSCTPIRPMVRTEAADRLQALHSPSCNDHADADDGL